MMTTVTVGSGGRITLPKKLRLQLGVVAGAHLTFSQLDDGRFVVRVKNPVSSLAGMLTRADQPRVSIEKMRR
jgi:AbrB family looped-hinge helix DNA binding protein